MIRASLLYLICLAILGFLGGIDGSSQIPDCEDKAPTDIYLNFSRVGLQRLSKLFVNGSSIKCLNLEGNFISEINEEAFHGVPELYYLNLAGNGLLIRQFIRTALPKLKTLIIDRPDEGYSYDIENYQSNLKNWSFFLPELSKLSLRTMRYLRLSELWLSVLNIPKLTHLDLTGNRLDSIANLYGLRHLTHLYLDDNYVEYFSESFPQNLEYLSMERNEIDHLCSTYCTQHSVILRRMGKLKHLSLAGNKIELIESDAFKDLENLLVLNLAQNAIQHFPRHAFDNMTNLKNLTLDKNKLTLLPALCPLKELEVLLLNDNEISSFDESAFCSLPKLAIIQLRNNRLIGIVGKSFAHLPALVVLDMSWNNISYLSENWISPTDVLQVLHLDGNNFTDIRNMSLEGLSAINSLSIGHNPVETISIRSLMKWTPDLSIDVSRDCQIPDSRFHSTN